MGNYVIKDTLRGLTVEVLRKLLLYDQYTGKFIWKVPNTRVHIGQEAGYYSKRYIMIGIGGYSYLAHRLAWLYVYGEWPCDQIDHINMDKKDNRISNLREATNSQNSMHKRLRADNISGERGVNKFGDRWQSWISMGGRNIFLGTFDNFKEACSVRKSAELIYHGEFSGSL